MKLNKLSKRQPLARKYNIKKKVSEHNRKLRRVAKKMDLHKKRNAKAAKIPNKWPFKLQMLQRLEAQRESEKEEARQRREILRQQQIRETPRNAPGRGADGPLLQRPLGTSLEAQAAFPREEDVWEDDDLQMTNDPLLTNLDNDESEEYRTARPLATLKDLAKNAEYRSVAHESSTPAHSASQARDSSRGRIKNEKKMRKVVERADTLLIVLDARRPSRVLSLESWALSAGKKVILVLNKIDLVPRQVVEAWKEHLSQSLPTVLFKAVQKGDRMRQVALLEGEDVSYGSADVVGVRELLEILKRGPQKESTASTHTVGVVGQPNVGKSSIINSLLRKPKALKAGASAGLTRELQEVAIDSKLHMIDCPGIVYADGEENVENVLSNAVNISTLKDPRSVATTLINRCCISSLSAVLGLSLGARTESADNLLVTIARKYGRVEKGGIPDLDAAARHLLRMWTTGSLRHYTPPPIPPTSETASHGPPRLLFNFLQLSEMTTEVVISDKNRKELKRLVKRSNGIRRPATSRTEGELRRGDSGALSRVVKHAKKIKRSLHTRASHDVDMV